ncbi:hypothetical protein HPB50_017239 [Hyalomma asiaticum]|uniref:Uncharacterized protein n=1 Tax=Hyalomma asiaticum TaxID=266040 RepID=A0ACB7RMM1_HYAAI|nr:hypothetical protein HPB50_017239 [Hyalomma asiaticum]
MAGSTVPQDITGVLRGRCKECDCNGFKRLVDLVGHDKVPVGWCILCGHSPVSHGALVNLCEGAQEGYPEMKWETERARKAQKLDCELGWSVSTRKTRKLRMKKLQLSSPSADNGPDRPVASSADAEYELKLALEAEVRFEAHFGGMEAKLQDVQSMLGRTRFI